MRINPMVKKDIKVQARSMRICWEIFAYEAIMAVVFFFAMFLFSQQMTYSSATYTAALSGCIRHLRLRRFLFWEW